MGRSSPPSLATYMLGGRRKSFSKEEVIHTSDAQHASVFLLCGGFVKSYTITPSGGYNILAFYGPDAIFPLGPVLRGSELRPHFSRRDTVYFEAMTDIEVCIRSLDNFFDTLQRHPDMYQGVTYRLLRNYEIYLARADSLQFRSAKERVAHHLLILMDTYGFATGSAMQLDIPLTHQDLADSLSLARETVSRAMEELKQNGLIETPNRHIIVNHVPQLRALLE